MTLKNNNLIGSILIAVGALAILGNLGIFGDMTNLLFAAGMGLGGMYLIRQYLKYRQQLWASIVGFTMLGLALASITGTMSGFYFFAMLGLGFIMIYRKESRHWWAVIPGGVLWTLATVAASEAIFPRWDPAALFFAGLAATFGYLFKHGKSWAIYPAIVLFIMAFLNFSFSGGWIVPALLIAAGLYVVKNKKESAVGPSTASGLVTVEKPSKELLIEKLSEPSSDAETIELKSDQTNS